VRRPRLTGGIARGRTLAVDVPRSARPTSARVREALFSLVGHDLSGLRVLDAFGGSGLLALEAWSRGADAVVVERNAAAVRAIKANVAALGADVQVVAGDVRARVAALGRFDGVFVDPPYAEPAAAWLSVLATVSADWLVLESADDVDPPEVRGLVLERRRCYGNTALSLYRALGDPDVGS